ncbi:MAG: PaeR7I family type II restriction endonuclease [Limisphaerales bacterium]
MAANHHGEQVAFVTFEKRFLMLEIPRPPFRFDLFSDSPTFHVHVNATGESVQGFILSPGDVIEAGWISDIIAEMENAGILAERPKYAREAVRFYWETRAKQLQKQRDAGGSDQGLRSAVTGGAQMEGFIELLTRLTVGAGVDRSHIYYRDSLELPGYFRPNKRWDFLVVVKNQLVAALEAKSQAGPSFGNNFNNRTEEAGQRPGSLDGVSGKRIRLGGSAVDWLHFSAGGIQSLDLTGERQGAPFQGVSRISQFIIC